MKEFFRSLFSQQFINNFYHLPKAVLANFLYGFPTRKLKVIGITGTDGKTTTTNMVYQILKQTGKKVSMISTINAEIAGKSYDTGFHVTSPDPFMVQKFANSAKQNRDEYLVLEVTSHSLDQYRFWGVKFEIGVITNITHDHLDYHGTRENYLNTKLKLVRDLKQAVINENLKQNLLQVKMFKGEIITFGLEKGDFNQKEIKLNLKIPGDYNIENALAVLAVAFVLNIDKNITQRILEKFSNLEGRMQEVKNSRDLKIIIDFAHTPNALSVVLDTLKKEARGKLIAVFGVAGKRDVKKRSLMGEIALNKADKAVVTAEDSRGELDEINKQIIQGAKKSGAKKGINLFVINDRQDAINFAINKLAKKGDTVGIFGKGHEKSINLDGKKEVPWSDFEAVKKALANG